MDRCYNHDKYIMLEQSESYIIVSRYFSYLVVEHFFILVLCLRFVFDSTTKVEKLIAMRMMTGPKKSTNALKIDKHCHTAAVLEKN